MISEPILGIIMLSIMVLAIFLGFPTAFTLMALGVLFGLPSLGWHVFDLMVQRTFAVMANDVLISIPLFMFMGYVMERSGIMDRMFHSYRLLFGPLPGALALTTMVVGTIFGIASGIVGAGVTLMGVLALPPMLRAGYSVSLAAGTITSSGTLGILIPPSVMLIVYGASAGVSVVKLYAGAFGPGFLLSALFLLYILVACLVKPSLAPPCRRRNAMSHGGRWPGKWPLLRFPSPFSPWWCWPLLWWGGPPPPRRRRWVPLCP